MFAANRPRDTIASSAALVTRPPASNIAKWWPNTSPSRTPLHPSHLHLRDSAPRPFPARSCCRRILRHSRTHACKPFVPSSPYQTDSDARYPGNMRVSYSTRINVRIDGICCVSFRRIPRLEDDWKRASALGGIYATTGCSRPWSGCLPWATFTPPTFPPFRGAYPRQAPCGAEDRARPCLSRIRTHPDRDEKGRPREGGPGKTEAIRRSVPNADPSHAIWPSTICEVSQRFCVAFATVMRRLSSPPYQSQEFYRCRGGTHPLTVLPYDLNVVPLYRRTIISTKHCVRIRLRIWKTNSLFSEGIACCIQHAHTPMPFVLFLVQYIDIGIGIGNGGSVLPVIVDIRIVLICH